MSVNPFQSPQGDADDVETLDSDKVFMRRLQREGLALNCGCLMLMLAFAAALWFRMMM